MLILGLEPKTFSQILNQSTLFLAQKFIIPFWVFSFGITALRLFDPFCSSYTHTVIQTHKIIFFKSIRAIFDAKIQHIFFGLLFWDNSFLTLFVQVMLTMKFKPITFRHFSNLSKLFLAQKFKIPFLVFSLLG